MFSDAAADRRRAADGGCTGAPIDLTAASTYTITENDVMASGGDGFPNVLVRGITQGGVDQVLADYIASRPGSLIAPAIQGRIVCTTSGRRPARDGGGTLRWPAPAAPAQLPRRMPLLPCTSATA